jgi:ABC-type branched-subunit amino acid transport system substrate-binding protein
MESTYHQPSSSVNDFTYGLDISTFQQSAQQAIVQFKAAGDTTVITACDPFSLALLTKAAVAQNYHPEWLLNGVAGDDLDSVAQTYDQSEVTGHLFGLSEAAPETATVGPDSPAGQLYQKLTGHQIPTNTDGDYSSLVWLFDALQAAGPDLTPANMARGVHAVPPLGAPSYAYGSWNFNEGPSGRAGSGDHTAVNDARWVYWNATGVSPDNGKAGTYVAVFGGKRYSVGQWPSQLPNLFGAG